MRHKIQQFVLNARLESIAWAIFLIMIGILWMIPDGRLSEDTWLLGVGVILLGLNGIRHVYHLKTSKFTIAVGVLALLAGLDDYLGFDIPVVPILIILLGVSILVGPHLFIRKWQKEWFGD